MERSYKSLDIIKFISSFLVIAIHTGPFEDINGNFNYFFCQILARIAVPFFFVCSGFLFYQKICSIENKKAYYLLYVRRILILYLFWSIVYIYWNYDFSIVGSNPYLALKAAVWYFWQCIFIGSHFHLWFIPALIFSVSVLYFTILYSKKKLIIVLFSLLYCIGLFGDSYYGFIKNLMIDRYVQFYFRFFGSTYNGLFFGSLFVMIGAVLKSDTSKRKRYLVLSVLFFVLLTIESTLLNLNAIPRDYNLYVMLVPFLIFFFKALLSNNIQSSKASKILRKLSIEIYFSHVLFVIIISAILQGMNFIYNSIILFIGVTLSSVLFCLAWIYISLKRNKVPII